jgi:hypothetical protein
VSGLVEAIPVAFVGARVTAQPLFALEQQPRRAQVDRGGDARQPTAQNHDRVHSRVDARVGLRFAVHVGGYLPTPARREQNARRRARPAPDA